MKRAEKSCKTIASVILKSISIKAAKFACNTASLNLCGQPKQPKSMSLYFKNKV